MYSDRLLPEKSKQLNMHDVLMSAGLWKPARISKIFCHFCLHRIFSNPRCFPLRYTVYLLPRPRVFHSNNVPLAQLVVGLCNLCKQSWKGRSYLVNLIFLTQYTAAIAFVSVSIRTFDLLLPKTIFYWVYSQNVDNNLLL